MANSISIGAAYKDQAIDGGTVDNTPVGATTKSSGAFTTLNATGATTLDGNVMIANGVADTVGHYGVTAISQRAGAAQATSLLSSSTDFTAAHLNALKEVMDTLTALGLWKGSA